MGTSTTTKLATGCLVVIVVFGGLAAFVAAISNRWDRDAQAAQERTRLERLTPEQRKSEAEAASKKAEQQKAEREHQQWIVTARGACRLAIEKRLNDPYSAKFDPSENWYVDVREGNQTLVQPKVRAKNGFGAYVYRTWNCEVKPEGDQVRILQLTPIG